MSHDGTARDGTWPVWLTRRAFIGWYSSQNHLRLLAGDDQLPDIPPDVGAVVGLRNDHEADVYLRGLK